MEYASKRCFAILQTPSIGSEGSEGSRWQVLGGDGGDDDEGEANAVVGGAPGD